MEIDVDTLLAQADADLLKLIPDAVARGDGYGFVVVAAERAGARPVVALAPMRKLVAFVEGASGPRSLLEALAAARPEGAIPVLVCANDRFGVTHVSPTRPLRA